MSTPMPFCWNCRRTANQVSLIEDGPHWLCADCLEEVEECTNDRPSKQSETVRYAEEDARG